MFGNLNIEQEWHPERYINREISWLRFNERVLMQAEAKEVPLLERLRFCAIFTSNLDEFFMVRAGSLHDRSLLPNVAPDNKTGQTDAEQLVNLYNMTRRLIPVRDRIDRKLRNDFEKIGIENPEPEDLPEETQEAMKLYFRREIMPLLAPMTLEDSAPFPHITNKIPHIMIAMVSKDQPERRFLVIVSIPQGIGNVHLIHKIMPESAGNEENKTAAFCFETTEQLVLRFADEMFPNCRTEGKFLFRVTRNADVEVEDNFSDDLGHELNYPDYIRILLEKREKLCAVRLEYKSKIGEAADGALDILIKNLGLSETQAYCSESPISYDFAGELINHLSTILPNETYQPIPPVPMKRWSNILEILKTKDVLLAYPYVSMRHYLDFLREAAYDLEVQSICITLYRLSRNSDVISLLKAAAENGKKVIVVVELKARFDEQNNIHWAEQLCDSGCSIVYGMNGMKVHSKVTLVTKKITGKTVQYAHIATGNYNESTAKLYTDVGILTSNPSICRDAQKLFEGLADGTTFDDYETLLVSPTCLKERLISEICVEKESALNGQNAYIRIKMNSLTDKEVIDELVEASKAGVRIDLIIRGICCLKAGIPGETDRIHVMSIVGRYLEHSRIFIFGEIDGNIAKAPPRVYIGSADMMTRNTTRRIEVITPIFDREISEKLISITDYLMKDNVKACDMLPDGTYKKRESNEEPFDSQMKIRELFIATE